MELDSINCLFPNDLFNVDVLQHLENDLTLDEKIALVFLLYDDIHVAQERLFLTFKAHREISNHQLPHMNLLHDWALWSGPSWREKLVEGLLIIKAYSNVKKLGLDVNLLRKHFLPDCLQTSLFIHPMKKVLYVLCESFIKNETKIVITTVLGECPNLTCEALDFEYLEYFLLKLFRTNFIQLGTWNVPRAKPLPTKNTVESDIKKFVALLKTLTFADHYRDLLAIEAYINQCLNEKKSENSQNNFSKKDNHKNTLLKQEHEMIQDNSQHMTTTFPAYNNSDDYNLQSTFNTIQLNSSKTHVNCYDINYANPIGLFVIINQIKFENENNPELVCELEDRTGSEADVKRLQSTWKSLGFQVLVFSNLNHNKMLRQIKLATTAEVLPQHSIFALCILSHGVKGAVYASDGELVEFETIEKLLYASEAPDLAQKPKLLFIQSCQGEDKLRKYCFKTPQGQLKHDGKHSVVDKSDMLVFYSTVPNFVSYRDAVEGTWFIQCLCDHIDRQDVNVNFNFVHLCVSVNNEISQKTNGKFGQMPEFTTCFRKLLNLKKLPI